MFQEISTVGDWFRGRNRIEQNHAYYSEGSSTRKSMKSSTYPKTSEALYIWFCMKRNAGLPLSGPLLREKAKQLVQQFPDEVEHFKASEGWLARWKASYGIRRIQVCGEKISADEDAVGPYCDELRASILEEGYVLDQIFNADETGLNYKMLPTQTLAFKTETSAPGAKMSKERVTVLNCANASGTFRLPLMVIGKAAKPRALKNIDMKTLPVYYRNQKNAWMDATLFKAWFYEEFVPKVKRFLRENDLPEKAVLLIDNAGAHPSLSQLKSRGVVVKFLPPNTTSLIQPMDQGVIVSFKRFYRKNLLQEILIYCNDDDITLAI